MSTAFTEQNFEQEVLKETTVPVLVDFWAEWCGPCKMIGPIIDELSNELSGRVKIGKVDVDANPQIASQYQVFSIPTLLIFKNGAVVERMVGYQSKKTLVEKLNAHV
jgi:thioredoxin 1